MYEAIARIFERVINNFYKQGVSVVLSDTPDTAYCAGTKITLPLHLLEEFTAQKLPRFTVLYHELGHALYSEDMTTFINKWKNLSSTFGPILYDDKYHHLINWIEDFYIEKKLLEDYPYLQDILGCLKRLTVPYDIDAIDKAFNYYYQKGRASLTLSPTDVYMFTNYINNLLKYRSSNSFGKGPISLLSNKSNETRYIRELIDFYNWCVSKGILEDNVHYPALSNPNNIIQSSGGQASAGNPSNGQSNNTDASDASAGGSYSDHSHIVRELLEVVPTFDTKEAKIFNEQFVSEEKLIRTEILDSNRVESKVDSLDGLFSSTYSDTSIMQSRIIIPNFFNPNRLIDQVLFEKPNKTFNKVSVYRDISGSTHGDTFKLINSVCEYLNNKIPIEYNFYLYSSGDISIMETQYQYWESTYDTIELYEHNPIYQQMGGGTNSSAIADVITEQLDDKWLNIIITDGDLYDLMRRDNIQSLLENVFVISVDNDSSLNDVPNKIIINDESEIESIAQTLNEWKGVI